MSFYYNEFAEQTVSEQFPYLLTGPIYIREEEIKDIIESLTKAAEEYSEDGNFLQKIGGMHLSSYKNISVDMEDDTLRIEITINRANTSILDQSDTTINRLVIYFTESPGKLGKEYICSNSKEFLKLRLSSSKDPNSSEVSGYLISKLLKELEARHKFNLEEYLSDVDLETDITISEIQVDRSKDKASEFKYVINNNFISDLKQTLYPYIKIDTLVDSFIHSESPMVILYGEPGTGKSKLATLLAYKLLSRQRQWGIWNADNEIYTIGGEYTKDPIAVTYFKNLINAGSNGIFLLDDLDLKALSDRGDGNNNIMLESLLTSLDGLTKANNKIIITTNKYDVNSESPLFRTGRLFGAINIIPLPISYVKRAFGNGIIPDDYNKDTIKASDLAALIDKHNIEKHNLSYDYIVPESEWK